MTGCPNIGCCSSPARVASARRLLPPHSAFLAQRPGKGAVFVCEVEPKGDPSAHECLAADRPVLSPKLGRARDLFAMSMDTEASLREYPRLQLEAARCRAARTRRALGV